MKLKTFKLILLNLIVNLITAFFLKNNYSFWFHSLFITGVLFLGSHLKNKKEYIFTTMTYTLFVIVVNFYEQNNFITSFFNHYILFLLFYTIGYLLKNNKNYLKIPFVFFLIFMSYGYKNYIIFFHELNSNNIKPLPKVSFYNENKQKITFKRVKDKIIVLDFWNTSCGVCFKKFPDFEKIATKYKNDPNIDFYIVNIPLKNQTIDDNIKFTSQKINYKIKKLFTTNYYVKDSLNINGFPKLLIIKNNQIYYNGSLLTDNDIYIHHIEKEIKKVLNL